MPGLPQIRAFWSTARAWSGPSPSTTSELLTRTGWARSRLRPYLTFFSRTDAPRERIDSALANTEIHELPAARGCAYIVPAPYCALALRVGRPFRESERKVAAKLGVTESEIDKLCAAILHTFN